MKIFEPKTFPNGLFVTVKEIRDFEESYFNLKKLLSKDFDLINLQYLRYKVLNGLIEVELATKILTICKKYAMYSNFYDKIQKVLSESSPMRVEMARQQFDEWVFIWTCS
jgi:hypothetical protein